MTCITNCSRCSSILSCLLAPSAAFTHYSGSNLPLTAASGLFQRLEVSLWCRQIRLDCHSINMHEYMIDCLYLTECTFFVNNQSTWWKTLGKQFYYFWDSGQFTVDHTLSKFRLLFRYSVYFLSGEWRFEWLIYFFKFKILNVAFFRNQFWAFFVSLYLSILIIIIIK